MSRIRLFFILLGCVFGLNALLVGSVHAQELSSPEPTPIEDKFFRARVEEVIREKTADDGVGETVIQEVRIRITKGEEEGKEVTLEYEVPQTEGIIFLKKGTKLVLGKALIGGETTYYISDVYRLNAMYGFLLLFALLTFVAARSRGITAFLGLFISLAAILFIMVPLLVRGYNPLLVCFGVSVLISFATIFVAHGFKRQTRVAALATMTTVGLSLFLSYIAVIGTKLAGLGTEEAFFLGAAGTDLTDLRGLLMGALVIGTLGVLDDVTTAQSATVFELSEANRNFSWKELYTRGLRVGREHIISLVNTLVLAYTGTALPLLLLFHVYNRPLWVVVNSELVMEEVVRMLVGSSTLMVAVPLTTLFAALAFGKRNHL
jgi:uncharacterized membrane protein